MTKKKMRNQERAWRLYRKRKKIRKYEERKYWYKANGWKLYSNEEDMAKNIQKIEQIITNKKSDKVWSAYHQGKTFQKVRFKEWFVNNMVSKFKVSKSTTVFKIALRRFIDDYPVIKNSSISLHYFKKTWNW